VNEGVERRGALRVPSGTASTLIPFSELMPEVAGYDECCGGLSFGVIGFGKMGVLHSAILNLLSPGSVKCVVERSRLLVFGASMLIGDISFYTGIDGMLRKGSPDVVYVTTPTPSHYEVVSRLLDASVRYIFVEKPPAANSKELASLMSKMGGGQLVMAGFQKRFALPFRHARMLLSKGVIGDVEGATAYIKSGDIAEPTGRFDSLGRGVLLDLGVHLVDLLTWILGARFVEASRCRSIHTRVDDHFEAVLRTEDGAKVDLEVSWCSPEFRLPETYIRVRGSKGVVEVTEDYLRAESAEEHPLLGDRKRLELYKPEYYRDAPPVNLADPEYTLENLHFLRCIRSGEEPLTSLRNVVETMEVIDELYRRAGVFVG